MPEESYLYALPYSLYRDHGVRRYGAHGTSHFYVTQEAAKMLNKPVEEVNVITCHRQRRFRYRSAQRPVR